VLNMTIVIGSLAKPVEVRALPSGISLASFDLSVPRHDGPADLVPVALFEAPDEVSGWTAGLGLLAIGRVRRRFFRVGGNTQSRTEVVAEKVVSVTNFDGISSALASVSAVFECVLEDLLPAGP